MVDGELIEACLSALTTDCTFVFFLPGGVAVTAVLGVINFVVYAVGYGLRLIVALSGRRVVARLDYRIVTPLAGCFALAVGEYAFDTLIPISCRNFHVVAKFNCSE